MHVESRLSSPRAASSPSRPPPMITARRAWRANAMIRSQSSSVRKTKTPSRKPPPSATQAIHARDDRLAARGHHERVVLCDGAVRRRARAWSRGRSRRPARPACSVTPRAAYQDSGLMRMSAGRVMPGENARQQDAVVVAVGLVAEDGHVEPIRAIRASRSSTNRAPAMPLPITTRRRRVMSTTRRAPRRP